jgi:hypothetical protein
MIVTPEGEARFTRTDGIPLPARPARPRGTPEALAVAHRAAGLRIDRNTPTGDWDGNPADLVACSDAFFAVRSSGDRGGDPGDGEGGDTEAAADGDDGSDTL